MNTKDAKNLFKQLIVVTGMKDKDQAPYIEDGPSLLIPYLIGWGVSVDQVVDHIGYERDIVDEVVKNKQETKGDRYRNWKNWCNGLGLTTDQVSESAMHGGAMSVKIVKAAIAWCKFANLPQWHTPPFARPNYDTAAKPNKVMDNELILNICCEVYRVTREEVSGKGRHPDVVMARGLITAAFKTFTFLSYPDISRMMRLPNHSTVITAHQRFSGIWIGAFGPAGPLVTQKLYLQWDRVRKKLNMPSDIQPKHQSTFYARTAKKIKSA